MSWLSGCLVAAAALALGQAIQVNNGFMHPRAFGWLVATLVLALAAVITSRKALHVRWIGSDVLSALLCVGVLLQIGQIMTAAPLMYAPISRGADVSLIAIGALLMAAFVAMIAVGQTRIRRAAFIALLICHASLGLWALKTVPEPKMDVVTVQRKAIAQLADLKSPYSFTFPNIYGNTHFYGEGLTSGDEVLFGLPYPPLTLAFTAPAQWAFGDFRIGYLLALTVAAILIASLGWTRHAMLAAALLLTTPRVLFQLEQGWTEPSGIMLLALTATLLWRQKIKHAALSLGLMMAVKQYLAVAALLIPLLPRGLLADRRILFLACSAATVVTLPGLLWDPAGFMNSVVLVLTREALRLDSLSVLAWLAHQGISLPTVAASLVAVGVALALGLTLLPRCTSGFAMGMALMTLLLFAFSKKAFCNYYFFVLGALTVAIAAIGEKVEDATLRQQASDVEP